MRWLIFIVLEGVSNSLHIKITANFLLGRWFLKENEMGECTSKWDVSDNKICPIVFWLLFLIGCWTLLFLHTAEVVFRQCSLLKCQRFMLYLSFDHELKSSEKNKIFTDIEQRFWVCPNDDRIVESFGLAMTIKIMTSNHQPYQGS